MTRISTFSVISANTYGIMKGQSEVNDAVQQSSSTYVATDLKGYGANAGRLVSTKNVVQNLTAKNDNLSVLQARATTEDAAFTSFTDAISTVRTAITNAVANSNGTGLDETLNQALSSAINAANTKYNGQYIFGGTRGYDQPITNTDLDTLSTQANTDGSFIDTGANLTTSIDTNQKIQLSQSAKEVFQPFMNFLQTVRSWENTNGKLDGKLSSTQVSYLQSQITNITSVQSSAVDAQANAGVVAKEIDNKISSNSAQLTTLSSMVGDIEDVDLSKVATQLSAAQTQYQASASIFSQIKSLNLLQYLN